MRRLFPAVLNSIAGVWRPCGAALLLLALLFATPPAGAQYARLGFGQFTHSRWHTDDGAPSGIGAIAQTPDGWLWLGAADGLYRFDGIAFERIAPPVGSPMERSGVLALLVTRSGELWVGFTQNGGVGVFRDGKLRDMGMPEPPEMITSMTQTTDGAILASWDGGYNEKRLFRWQKGRWETSVDNFGMPDGFVEPFCATADGTRWAGVFRPAGIGMLANLPPGARRFQISPYPFPTRGTCHGDRQGRLWLRDASGVRLVMDADGKRIAHPIAFPALPGITSRPFAIDGSGGLWQASDGVYYTPDATRLPRTADDQFRRFSTADGLTGNAIYSVFVDRENTIWLGSDAGLDQFRTASVFMEPALAGEPGTGYSIKRTGNEAYISNSFGVFQISPGQPRKVWGEGVGGTCAGRNGGVWTVDLLHYSHFYNSTRRSFPTPAGVTLTGACAEDSSGRLWIITADRRLMWHDDSGWHSPERAPPAPRIAHLLSLPRGEVAYATANQLVRLNGNRVTITKLAPYDPGTITKIEAGPRDIFVCGSNALLRIRGERVARLDWRRFPWIAQLRMVIQTSRGDTWLRKGRFLSRVKTADLDRAFDNPGAPLTRDIYGPNDGVDAPQASNFPGEQGVVTSDGKLWLLNQSGPSFIDPERLLPDTRPPPVVIQSLASAGNAQLDPSNLTLPPGTHALDISFAALTMVASKQVQFRYRLEGVDDGWIDPGNRRSASYTNLGPGRYRFQVRAANRDGVWNNTGATLAFEIRPTFVQSWPFKLLCGLVLLGLLWLAYSVRLRAVANRIQARMTERLEERERIARELHDTLLQSVQTLTLRFQLAADDLPEGARVRGSLEQAIDLADEVVAEGRDRVRDLRSTQERSDIEQIVADIVARQDFDSGTEIAITTTGTPRALDPLVLEEISRVAGEAIFNVRRHAAATRVAIEIGFRASFSLCVADDGVGIDAAIAEGGKDGHFGLSGMRERARKLGGEFSVRPVPDGGTMVVFAVPGHIAYKSGESWLSRLRKRGRRPPTLLAAS